MFPCWIAQTDIALAQVILSEEDFKVYDPYVFVPTAAQRESAHEALDVAQEILGRLSGGRFHGPGYAVDEYMSGSPVRRVSTTFRPLRAIEKFLHEGVEVPGMVLRGQSAYFGATSGCNPRSGFFQLTYRFGSTITPAARANLLYYAHELYLAGPNGDSSECSLPERVLSINREGVSMSLIDPQVFLDKGRTGLTRIDSWLSAYLTTNTGRRSGFYGSDSPPPVNVAVWCEESLATVTSSYRTDKGIA